MLIQGQSELVAGLHQMIKRAKCNDENVLFRLLHSGLIYESTQACYCRNGLYQLYFEKKFVDKRTEAIMQASLEIK